MVATHRSRTLARASTLALCLLVSSGTPSVLVAETTTPTSVTDLAWIAGNWVGGDDDSFIQEQWSAPHGGDMMGMFRLIKNDQVAFYEFMTLSGEPSGLTLRIKHFDPGLVGWEERGESIVFELIEIGDRRAVFATEKDGHTERLLFERQADELAVTLEKPEKGTRSVFRYQLQER